MSHTAAAAAGVAETAQQPELRAGAATRKKGRPKASATLQAPASRQSYVPAFDLPTWQSGSNSAQRASAFSRVNRPSDRSGVQPGVADTAAAQAPWEHGGAADDDSIAARGNEAGIASEQQHVTRASQGGTGAARDDSNEGQPQQTYQPEGPGPASGGQDVGSAHDRQPDSSVSMADKQGRQFWGFNVRGDAEVMARFDGMTPDAKNVFYTASKMGMRPDVLDRAAAQLKQLPGLNI